MAKDPWKKQQKKLKKSQKSKSKNLNKYIKKNSSGVTKTSYKDKTIRSCDGFGKKKTKNCKIKDDKVSKKTKVRDNKKNDSTTEIGGLEITVSRNKDRNRRLGGILSGGLTLPKLGKPSFPKRGRKDEYINIDEDSDWGQHLDDSFST
jgi:hypothetical protein